MRGVKFPFRFRKYYKKIENNKKISKNNKNLIKNGKEKTKFELKLCDKF